MLIENLRVKEKESDKFSNNYFLNTRWHKPELKIKHIPFYYKKFKYMFFKNFWINTTRGGDI